MYNQAYYICGTQTLLLYSHIALLTTALMLPLIVTIMMLVEALIGMSDEKTPHLPTLRYCGVNDWRPSCVILALAAMVFAL